MPSTVAPASPRRLRNAVRDWTASVDVDEVPEVPGASPEELKRLAALGGLAAVFGANDPPSWPTPLVRWAFKAPRPPERLLELFRSALDSGLDPFAEAYTASVSAENRRRLGTVFTPDVVVEHMLDLVDEQLTTAPTTVIDPGAGVGAFTLAAARRWPEADIIAVDVNVVTLGLLGARLAHERTVDDGLDGRAGAIQLRLADYLDELPSLFSPSAPGPVVALGNPPYTRTQALPAAYKQRAAALGRGMITSGHANLAMLFKAVTVASLRPQDASCMVVPGSIMFTRAARDLRRELFASTRPVQVHRWPATARAFIGRNVQAAIIMVGPQPSDGNVGPMQLARAEADGEDVRLLDGWSLDRSKPEPANWYWPEDPATPKPNSVPLTEVARIRRGLATGANAFFFLTDEMAAGLPSHAVVPAVPSLRRFNGEVLNKTEHASWGGPNQRRWLLALKADAAPSKRVQAYLDRHEAVVSARHLCGQRDVWWAITDQPQPDILLSPLAKTTFKIVHNRVGAVPSNNLIGITVKHGDPDRLAGWLRSAAGQAELLRVSRRYHGGSHKIEPGDLRRLHIPRSVAAALKPSGLIGADPRPAELVDFPAPRR